MRVLLVNASNPAYNLGMRKAADWWRRQGADVKATHLPLTLANYDSPDIVWFSAIFSWHVPAAVAAAKTAKKFGAQVEIGGPGTFGVREYVNRMLGQYPQSQPDPRFEREPGRRYATFWSRGCPAKNCSLGYPRDGMLPICSVPEMEGWRFTLYADAQPAPFVMDNNLSALPRAHQELIVERTLGAGFGWVDLNSGFEPRSIRPETIELWRRLPLKAWRFAYDEIAEQKAVWRVIEMLDAAGIKRRNLRIYCIAGNEPMAACEQRVREIQSWGCLPIVQRRRPLSWLGGELPVLFDWTEQKLIDFQRWGTRLSKSFPFSEYKRGVKGIRARDGAPI